jgi:hypothetical protein
LRLFHEIIRLCPEILFQGEGHRLDPIGEQTCAETRYEAHRQNTAQNAATIDCIH